MLFPRTMLWFAGVLACSCSSQSGDSGKAPKTQRETAEPAKAEPKARAEAKSPAVVEEKPGVAFCEALLAGSKIAPDDVEIVSVGAQGEETRLGARALLPYFDEIHDCSPSDHRAVEKLASGRGWYFGSGPGLGEHQAAYVDPEQRWGADLQFRARSATGAEQDRAVEAEGGLEPVPGPAFDSSACEELRPREIELGPLSLSALRTSAVER